MPPPAPFWLCHECGAQMRPVTIDGVPHCASCNGEFIEILDPTVNPDPFHELPPAPPTRPSQGPSSSSPPRNAPQSPSQQHHDPGQGGQSFLSSFLGNILGAAADHSRGEGSSSPGSNYGREASPSTNTNTGLGGGDAGGGGGGGRTFSFNFPGGGRGQVMFGSFNGGGMGGMGMGPFGPSGQGRTTGGMDFESLFPQGFGPPPRQGGGQNGAPHPLGPGDPMDGGELLRALMAVMGEEGQMGPGLFFGGPGRGNLGDYATSEQGFNDILERLMQAAGPQGPLPASDIVIDGLPRFKFDDEKKLAQSTYKDCPVCKDDFALGDEVVRIPCAHIFHPDCLVPWLKQNGSCPVCRFSLVPEGEDRSRRSNAPASEPGAPPGAEANSQEGGQSTMTSILNRLFGQAGGTTSNPTSPTGEQPVHTPFGVAGEAAARSPSSSAAQQPPTTGQASIPGSMPNTSQPTSHSAGAERQNASDDPPSPTLPASGQPSISTAIPEEYRARHRERERRRQQEEDDHG
ncbi:uncharacterized protein I303_105933 [Kwoniella dejecticola CBS 10117]|uniref:RING-type domain-containing protein n=1 Tax=Kwoniella dejecticola CBS 10117 TaxID=1296121 RepID=A0A1A6A0V0_9TREE|nr:uncharacterized protein I303_05956 [Kwoniella dejecticola CBS 10117]OBR83676.1 hypothetical protein I303_05956 [Kwoniella dejecticola CBS 10117]